MQREMKDGFRLLVAKGSRTSLMFKTRVQPSSVIEDWAGVMLF